MIGEGVIAAHVDVADLALVLFAYALGQRLVFWATAVGGADGRCYMDAGLVEDSAWFKKGRFPTPVKTPLLYC